jgi:hypothetical protein
VWKLAQINHLIQVYLKTGQMRVASEEIVSTTLFVMTGGLFEQTQVLPGKSKLLTIYYPY